MWETRGLSLGQEDPLEKEMATHSSTLAWKIPWMKEPGGLQFMGSQRIRHNKRLTLSLSSAPFMAITAAVLTLIKPSGDEVERPGASQEPMPLPQLPQKSPALRHGLLPLKQTQGRRPTSVTQSRPRTTSFPKGWLHLHGVLLERIRKEHQHQIHHAEQENRCVGSFTLDLS